jgi:hypothetical protein
MTIPTTTYTRPKNSAVFRIEASAKYASSVSMARCSVNPEEKTRPAFAPPLVEKVPTE